MTYYFQHPEHTGNEIEDIGTNEVEAMNTLKDDYDLELEDIFNLTIEGHVWQGEANQ